ncbi:1-acylglycerol-3-phosphate O-acyltransferase [Coemansia spiralis]|uniref:1-acylglycerol-3-phosphate O-acyltransferase n=2 Tax=Coemansia TaxID=4863 RepID=A0A9W8G608_9FUNG|nr:1-acylglycerol-3-phosphate O-acyltransferase [Coemansia umbellata]KAJ2675932.1 1-acylglycerol-3-phosphate O-acyltransferase [Coemansia spiralis]
MVASPLLRMLRRKPTVNWVGALAMRILAEHILGITVEVIGAENLVRARDTPCIIVANHQNLLDTVWLSWVFPRKAVLVANKFISRIPVLGWFMRLGGSLFVEQGDKQSIKALFEDSLHYLEKEKTSIVMFPEGKRNPSETGALLEFKKGAFYLAYCTHAPVIPIAVQCTHSLYSWPDFCFRRNCIIRIRVLAPISTQFLTEEDIPTLVADTRRDIQKACLSLTSLATQNATT